MNIGTSYERMASGMYEMSLDFFILVPMITNDYQ